jgi:acetyltransferase-like isoleucine patch superfamily enzyme
VRLDSGPEIRNKGVMRIGKDVIFRASPVQSHLHVEPGGELMIGDRVYIGQGVSISSRSRIEIGDDVRIADYVIIMDTDYHDVNNRHLKPEAAPIFIGRGSIIGARATVLRGTHIGENVEVGPGSLVFGRIAARARVSGVPARRLTSAASKQEIP